MNIVFGHTKSKSGEFSYVELYNAFSAYMRAILKEMYRKEPTKIIHKAAGDKTIPFSKISELKTFENIENYVIESVFRKLEEERSTLKLLNKILENTKVTIDEDVKNKALMYLEMRHLFIHNDGQADAEFISKYSSIIKFKQDAKTNNTKLPTDFTQVYTAIEAVQALLAEIDKQLLFSDFIDPRKYAPTKQK